MKNTEKEFYEQREEKEETSKDKKEWLRINGQLNFFRGGKTKYKVRHKKRVAVKLLFY